MIRASALGELSSSRAGFALETCALMMSVSRMPELLSIHGRCPRCSQVLTVPAGQLQGLFRCARCQYRVLGAALMEEARVSPPRLAGGVGAPVVRPFEESADDQHTRLHLPASGEEEAETVLPAQLVDAAGNSLPPRVVAAPLRRFGDTREDPDDQQTRLHVAGGFDAARGMPRAPREEATVRGVPAPPRLSRFGDEPDEPDDQATRLHFGAEPDEPGDQVTRLSRFGAEPDEPDDQATRLHFGGDLAESPRLSDPGRIQTTRGMPVPAIPPPPPSAPLARFDAGEDDDQQHTRLQVPIAYEEEAAAGARQPSPALPAAGRASLPGRATLPELRSPMAPRISLPVMPEPEPVGSGQRFGRAALQVSRWIDDWVRERHAVLLLTLAALSAVIAPIFDVVLGNPRQGATVIAANLALFFLWALAYAWSGKLVNDAGVWDYRIAFTRLGTSARLALADLQGFGMLPLPLRWRVAAELSGALGLVGLALASVLTLTHLVFAWPEQTGVLFLWRLFAGGCVVLAVIAQREAVNVPAGLSPAPDVTAPAITYFPALVDLSAPLPAAPDPSAAPLHQVLEVLAQWLPRQWPNQDSYVAALERHFLRRVGWSKLERERRLGTERSEGLAHLIVDDSLLLEVVRGFDVEIAERVSLRMRRLAKVWRGRPALIVVFDASRSELASGRGAAQLEALHQAYPMLAVRMASTSLV